jgi:hypothetical protein
MSHGSFLAYAFETIFVFPALDATYIVFLPTNQHLSTIGELLEREVAAPV